MARLGSASRRSFAARAKVRRGWGEIKMGLEVALAAKSPAITAAAGELSAASRCRESSTKTRLSLVADCKLETRVTVMELSPRRRQPSFSARARRVCFMVVYCRFPGRVCTPDLHATRGSCRAVLGLDSRGRLSLREPGRARAPVPTQPQELSTVVAGRGGGFSSGGGPIAIGQDSGG